MGYTEEDYGKYLEHLKKDLLVLDQKDLSYLLISYPEKIDKCEGLIKILKAIKSGNKKPDEKLLQSTTESMLIEFVYASFRTPSDTLEEIPKSRDNFNKRLDDLKSICLVFKDYGITDRDYQREYAKDDHSCYNHTLDYLLSRNREHLEEGTELAKVIRAYGFEPNKSWWDRMFRKKPMDETLQAMLNRLLTLYIRITTTW